MSFPDLSTRRPVEAVSLQALLLGGCAVGAAAWVAVHGSQSVHAFAHQAVPILIVPFALWLFFSERYWLTLGVLLLYLGLLDGVVKLTSGSSLATLGRDVLLYAIALGALSRMVLRNTPLTAPPFVGFVLAWVAVCLMQLANPSDISFVHAAAALRQHLEFVPLFFFGYIALRSERRLAGLLILLLVAAALNGIVGLIQTRLSPQGLASWGPGYALLETNGANGVARVFLTATGQTAVRPPGLGGEDGFGGFVGLIAIPGAIALLSSFRRTALLGWLLIPATMLTIVGIVTSQSRLDVVGGVIAFIAFLALTLTSRHDLAILLLTTVVGLAGYFIVTSFSSSNANRYSNIAPSQIVGSAVKARGGSLALIPTYFTHYPLGAGLGSVGPASQSTIGGASATHLNGETEFTFLLVETGIPGLLVMVGFMVALIRAGFALRRVADRGVQRCLMALTAVLISLLAASVIGAVTADSPASPFLWLSAGCLAYWYQELRRGHLRTRPRRIRNSLARS